jgi:hypothetical protein
MIFKIFFKNSGSLHLQNEKIPKSIVELNADPGPMSSSVCLTTLALTQGVVALSIIFISIGIAWLIWKQRRKPF